MAVAATVAMSMGGLGAARAGLARFGLLTAGLRVAAVLAVGHGGHERAVVPALGIVAVVVGRSRHRRAVVALGGLVALGPAFVVGGDRGAGRRLVGRGHRRRGVVRRRGCGGGIGRNRRAG